LNHFPHIYERCLEEGYDVTKDWIPVVPAQHYFMGGIHVDKDSKTTMNNLFAAGETSCNGVHGANRLASNSLLESLVFAKRAAMKISESGAPNEALHREFETLGSSVLTRLTMEQNHLKEIYKQEILAEIERERQAK